MISALLVCLGAILVLGLISSLFAAVSRAMRPLLRGVGRVALALWIAVSGGLIAGVLAENSGVDVERLTAAVTFGLFPIALLILRALKRADPPSGVASSQREPAIAGGDGSSISRMLIEKPLPAGAGWGSRLRSFFSAKKSEDSEVAWERLASALDWAPNRISVIKRSCERSAAAAQERKLDPSSHDHFIILNKRVPELIENQLARVGKASERERRQILNELLDLLEEVAAHCERRDAELEAAALDPEHVGLRNHIQNHVNSGGLRPL